MARSRVTTYNQLKAETKARYPSEKQPSARGLREAVVRPGRGLCPRVRPIKRQGAVPLCRSEQRVGDASEQIGLLRVPRWTR